MKTEYKAQLVKFKIFAGYLAGYVVMTRPNEVLIKQPLKPSYKTSFILAQVGYTTVGRQSPICVINLVTVRASMMSLMY